ncbi:MAG: hypothetical protein FWF05_04325 [Oscillospiraceae bacterium]|nr:hypothetical protein [Oscillospiraceae bacterium]
MTFEQNMILIPKNEAGQYLLYGFESKGNVIIPPHYQPKNFSGDTLLWILPADAENGAALQIQGGAYRVKMSGGAVRVTFIGGYTKREYPVRPACDFFGRGIRLEMANGDVFEHTYAQFYWDNLLPQIAERTFMRKKQDVRGGYVLSTLNKRAYAGTYPAVDHEFQMKGRFAVGGAAEAGLIRRMLELQMKIMREDKTAQSKNVCSVQPSRRREYDVWRKSRDHKCEAQMFRVTANIEFTEGMYNYYCLTKDVDFLRTNIDALERNCAYIESFVRPDGLLDSHVYYEDQVIKDGPVAQAQCFAVNSFRLMARLEGLLGRQEQVRYYSNLAQKLGEALGQFWDTGQGRYIDWIDARGERHDHIHLLANQLPVLFGLADESRAKLCAETIAGHENVFGKFPSFVAAKIEDYTESEIGTGGPYDLCAAGRYWCWDAEYLTFQNDGGSLLRQLLRVAAQAQEDGYFMGERYDMNYVYYNTGKDGTRNWHGASLYYEYPNVFLYVLVCHYLGVRRGFDCDLVVNPLIREGTVTLDNYGISYRVFENGALEITNTSGRSLLIDLPRYGGKICLEPGESKSYSRTA